MSRNPSNTSHTTSGAHGPPTLHGPPYSGAIEFPDSAQNSTSNLSGQYVGNSASGGNSASNAASGQHYGPSEGAGSPNQGYQSYAMASWREQSARAEPYHGTQGVSSDSRGGAGVSGSAAGVNQSGGQAGGYGGGDSRQGDHRYQNGDGDARSQDATWGSRSSSGNRR